MTDTRSVQAGNVYAVEIERNSFRVRALHEAPAMPGWWLCEGEFDREQVVLPESSLREPAD